MNAKSQITNVLPLVEARAKKSWICNAPKVDDPIIVDRYERFLQAISLCTFKKISELLQKIHTCTIKENSNIKLGHTHSCYINTTLCKAMSLPIQLLSPDFPKIRYIKRFVYKMTSFYRRILQLQKSLTTAELDTLNEIIIAAEKKANIRLVLF